MRERFPHTPFSTFLTGPAKETEGRIRNIFQGRRKRPPVLLMGLAALVILSCGGLVSCQSETAAVYPAIPSAQTVEPLAVSVGDYLKQPEYFTREIDGAETDFYRYEGDGWAIDMPSSWTQDLTYIEWGALSQNASFQVIPFTSSAQNVKALFAQTGSWSYQTDMPEPFHEYYDGGIHETQPDGTAQYQYYFVPVSDGRSYLLMCCGVWGVTSETEWEQLHTILQSFTVDESLHSVRAEPYLQGSSELAAALAGVADPQNPVWLDMVKDGYSSTRDGRQGESLEQYADALRAFTYTLVGRVDGGPTPEELQGRSVITVMMENIGCNLYFYEDSDLVYLYWRGAEYQFTASDPARPGVSPYEAAYAWFERAEADLL